MTLDSPPTRRRSFQFGIKEMAISIALMAAALSMLRAWCLLFERAWGTRYAEWLMDASPIASTVISCCACTSIGVLLHSVKSGLIWGMLLGAVSGPFFAVVLPRLATR